jgi:hypothetical protein
MASHVPHALLLDQLATGERALAGPVLHRNVSAVRSVSSSRRTNLFLAVFSARGAILVPSRSGISVV